MSESKASDQGQLLVGVALAGSRKAKYILRWALEKFLPEGNVAFKIFHVYPKITLIPTVMGTYLHVSQVREEVVARYRKEFQWKKQKKLLPYQQTLKEQKIKSEIVLLESDDIAMALSLETARQAIRHLVIGVTATGIFSMKNFSLVKGEELSRVISETAPSFCTVYCVADGKLQQVRPADTEQNVITGDDTSNFSSTSTESSSSSSSLTIGRALNNTASSTRHEGSSNSFPSTSQRKQPESHPNKGTGPRTLTKETVELKHHTFKDAHTSGTSHTSSSGESGSWVSNRTTPEGSFSGTLGARSEGLSPIGTPLQRSYMITPPPTGVFVNTTPEGTQGGSDVEAAPGVPYGQVSFMPLGSEASASINHIYELQKLRMELKHTKNNYEWSENNTADGRLQDISKDQLEDPIKLEEEKAKEIARMEMNKSEAAESQIVGENAERNQLKNKSDTKATHEAEENRKKLKKLFESPAVQYQKFTWQEIMEATSSLSEEFKVGMGAFGTVYRCKLHHTTVAVKVLHLKDSVTNKQFVQELEILSTIRHPHLLLLLGAVPEESCLIYEYMDYGSLDDILFRKNNKPPLPWYDRFRICCEVAGALAFLHSTKPRPIIHRDLKPANILLDHHLISKIGDAGLGTMINVEPSNLSLKTIYKETSPVGTLCYIDPEYQRTGRVSTKSDIYALGVVILQLLTAKPAVGIAYTVEDAIDEGTLTKLLDPEAGEWPEKETLELAQLGLQCAELRGRDRPDLKEKVLPFLERLKEVADNACTSASNSEAAIPTHFFCPILKNVMEDPYVAADGYTYDKKAIERWLEENDTSPTTNQPLPHKFIMPNTTMLDAIKQWKSKRSTK